MKHLILSLCLMLSLLTLMAAEQIIVNGSQNEVRLLSSSDSQVVMELSIGYFNREAVSINGDTWYHINLKKEGISLEAGMPQVPILARSVIIPNNAKMSLSTLGSEYVEYNMPIAPSKGNLTRDIDPATVPYTFSPFYASGRMYPLSEATLSDPFIIRDYRGITVHFSPFVYYPATQTLRVYTKIKIALTNVGSDTYNSFSSAKNSYNSHFEELYKSMFLNFNDAKYPILEEEGKILVIKNSMFDATLQPWVDWKRQKGLEVEVVDLSVAGPTANQIKTYIANRYTQDPSFVFVQIVGDAPQVPTLTSGGGGSDPSYVLITGNDSYPEMFIGRFSAQTLPQLQTQVQRTIHYERDIQVGADWLQKGMGIASNEGGGSQGDMGESDQVHMENIRQDLLGYGYTSVDQVYQAQGATATQVSNYLNNGRGFINYVGHGSNTTWVTTGFSNTHVDALTNDNMLPFIVSVACVNGNFVSITCFAEAWLNATNNTTGAPTGAIAHYASTINQSWNPPMRGQDEITDLLIAEQKQTIGGLYFNGSSKMVEVYGADGISMYKTWHIFGDASLVVRTKNPMPLAATYNPVLFLGVGVFEVNTVPGARVAISSNNVLLGSAIANSTGLATVAMANPPLEPSNLTLTITAFNRQTHIGTVQVLPSTGPYVVVNQMVVNDGNNNTAEYGETINLNIQMGNVGSDVANGVNVTISSADQYLTILNTEATVGNIPANGTATTTNGFGIQIANNVPDQHAAQILIMISSGNEVWEYTRSLVISAPNIDFGSVLVSEVSGNGNGRVDAGETIQFTLPITNSGHAQGNNILAALIVGGTAMTINDPVSTSFYALPVSATVDIVYNVTFSSQIPMGTQIPLTFILAVGDYSFTYNTSVTVGLMMEDFENGFNNFPWTFTGGNWTLDTNSPYSGTNSAKSATISHNQSTSMVVTMSVPEQGDISFYKKVSSEANYDFLKFYINNVLKNQWSGNVTWSQETYAVNPGTATFKWEYMKDNIVSSGGDCAWIDNIVFPAVGGTNGVPAFSSDTYSMDFGTIFAGELASMPITIQNNGTATMIGTMTAPAPFYITPSESEPVNTLNYIIPAGQSLSVEVNFMPGVAGAFDENLLITSDDPTMSVFPVGLTGIAQPVDIGNDVIPVVTALKGNFPNPFNPTTSINFSIKEPAQVKIDVYNMLGQKVKTLVNGYVGTGNHSVVWNGVDDRNRNVASGIYFYRMQAGKYTSTKKMIMMK